MKNGIHHTEWVENTGLSKLEAIKLRLHDALYIGDKNIPNKKDIGRCYRSDFSLKTRNEVETLVAEHKKIQYIKDKNADFFVYNERYNDVIPFKKNDYLIYDRGYLTSDGTNYISYDDNGNELWRFSFKDEEPEEIATS